MPRPRSWRIAASPQAATRLAGIAACLLATTGRGGPLVSGLPTVGPRRGPDGRAAHGGPLVAAAILAGTGWSLSGVAASRYGSWSPAGIPA